MIGSRMADCDIEFAFTFTSMVAPQNSLELKSGRKNANSVDITGGKQSVLNQFGATFAKNPVELEHYV